MEFIKRRNVDSFVIDIHEIVAEYFTNDDMAEAYKILNRKNVQYRRLDIVMLTFFGGGSALVLLILLCQLILHKELFMENEEGTDAAN